MKARSIGRQGLFLCVALTLLSAAPARSETVTCLKILRVPSTISRPGVYCLARDFATAAPSGTAITINANDVVLDLNGHTLDGSAAGLGTATVGIAATGHSNITIKNGTVRGFLAGIRLAEGGDSFGHLIEGIRADRNTSEGISVGGEGSRVRGNYVSQTGGSTAPLAGRAYGILVSTPGGVVADNQVVGTTAIATSYAYGIHATRCDGLVIEGNRVVNEAPPPAYSFGILVPFSEDVLVVNNRLSHLDEGVTYSSGGTGKYRDNLTTGVVLPFAGTGTDAGNNN